jgi:thiol-disulfide isomerase/thioredoxin
MNRKLLSLFVVALSCSLAARPTSAAGEAEPKLKPGDSAPQLSISKWVKGEPVKGFEKGKIYVVEFWATWCGPCKVSIPHVSQLQAKYKDKGLTVIGVDIWERDVAMVEPFVKEMGDKMGYTVGIEEPIAAADPAKARAEMPKGRMATDWMEAAGQQGIPCSFVVDRESKIAWVGHPMAMGRVLEKVVAGTFDVKANAELEKKIDALNEQVGEAAQAKEFDKALKLRDEIIALDADQADQQNVGKLALFMQKGDTTGGNKLAGELADRAAKEKDSMLAARTASMLLSGPLAGKMDADLALRAAESAFELSDKSVMYQRLLAQAYAGKKQYGKAVELQTKVVGQIVGPLKAREEKVLEEYKKGAAGPS